MLKRNLFFTFTLMIFALASLILDTFNYNPFEAKTQVFINFYLSLALALTSAYTLIIYYLKYRHNRGEVIYHFFWPSARQGLLVAVAITASLILQGLRLLDPWIGISVIAVVCLLELFFQTKNPVTGRIHQGLTNDSSR